MRPRFSALSQFLSYCADFGKDNPTPRESFEVGSLPDNLKSLLRNISAYHKKYPDRDDVGLVIFFDEVHGVI
jgi:hypothetical protein